MVDRIKIRADRDLKMICRDRKLIFIHVPKTGGTSIEDMLWPHPRRVEDLWMGIGPDGRNAYQTGGLQHLTAQLVKRHVGDALFDACYVFALVRHPVDRIISQFNFLNNRPDLLRLLGLDGTRSFSDYLSRIVEVEHVQWMPQSAFLLDDGGRVMPELFRLEDVSENFGVLAGKIGLTRRAMIHSQKSLPEDVPETWVTQSRDWLSSDHLERIRRIYKDDFDLLGYD